ncbi:MAG: hypothetical protein K9M51_00160 [Candidatus Gracilibacteria bacterium]|nr:hypothetical protein [Candidatus Gracilibacteria bacterium]
MNSPQKDRLRALLLQFQKDLQEIQKDFEQKMNAAVKKSLKKAETLLDKENTQKLADLESGFDGAYEDKN